MLIAERNAMLVNNSILPKGARWVEYLESDSSRQYINTGITLPRAPFDFYYRCDVYFKNFTLYDGYCAWAGANYGWNTNINNSNGQLQNTTYALSANTWYDILYTNNNGANRLAYVDGVVRQTRSVYQYDGKPPTFGIFCATQPPQVGGGIWTYAQCRLRKTDMGFTKNGVTSEYKFRPIAIGNTGYMLDLVTGEYEQYGNQGTGDFIIGPDISRPAT